MTSRDGKTLLVTGASGGLASALLPRLDLGGFARVGLHHRAASDRLPFLAGAEVRAFEADLGSPAACANLAEAFLAWTGGRADAVVMLHGGILASGPWRDVAADAMVDDVVLNGLSQVWLARALVPALCAAPSGSLVLVSTASVAFGGGGESMAYAFAKGGLETVARRMARDVASESCRINVVAPGFIDTGFHERWKGMGVAARQRRAELVPMGRAGQVDDLVGVYGWLLSDASQFTTGQVIRVSGGDEL